MNLYLVKSHEPFRYNTYDEMVVSAESEDEARKIHPSPFVTHYKNGKWMGTYSKGGEYENEQSDWVAFRDIGNVEVKLIGESYLPKGVVLTSYNA